MSKKNKFLQEVVERLQQNDVLSEEDSQRVIKFAMELQKEHEAGTLSLDRILELIGSMGEEAGKWEIGSKGWRNEEPSVEGIKLSVTVEMQSEKGLMDLLRSCLKMAENHSMTGDN